MRVIVLGGCGEMGSEATRDLAQTSDFEEIVIADIDLSKAQRLADELGGGRVRVAKIDASDEDALVEKFKGFDVVANCTTYHFGMTVVRAAILAKVSYLDLGGLYNTPRQLELDEDARRAGVTICLGCGATPGVTNLMARRAADQLDEVSEVHISFASFRSIAPSPGLLDTVLDEFSPGGRRFYWQAGEFTEVPAFSGAREVRFAEPVGTIEVYYVPHSETHTLPRFLGKGVSLVDVRGTWRPEIMRALRVFADFQLTGNNVVSFKNQEVNSKAFLRQHILEHAADLGGEGEWAFLLNVEVLGKRDGKLVRYEYTSRHPTRAEWGTTATARVTGIPASIGAQKLARGEVARVGVVAPEICFEPQSFFQELSRRGIIIKEQVETSE
ncbi:MAG TPA: saccharopine dehydrogenase NADP-binding domain-containing protein [Pyrinomonadaceae bacterium]|nr:saccharopine dehydrogenase NADP-binding domain-containing protein [Pyrinomonadaceae bacterium]